MPVLTAKVTGTVFIPGTTIGVRAKLTATPLSSDAALVWPDDNVVSWGPASIETDSDGDIPGAGLEIPVDSSLGDALLWRFTAKALDRPELKTWHMGTFAVTADVELATLILDQVEPIAYDAATIASFQSLVDDAETAATAAELARDDVEAVVATTAGLMASVDADDGSLFRTQQDLRLSATYVRATDPAGDPVPGMTTRIVFDANGDVEDILMEAI